MFNVLLTLLLLLAVTGSACATAFYVWQDSPSLGPPYTNPTGAVWMPLPGQTDIPGTGATQTLTDPAPGATRFYRVGVRLP
jgi:hypothetical protein